jgi:[protein-PII] uridylyltransferase
MRHQDALTSLPAAAPYEFEARLRQLPSLTGDPKTDLAAARGFVEAVHRRGGSGHTVVRLLSAATDRVVAVVWARALAAAAREHPATPLALVALGGYGRRELAPHSDLDLLVLHPDGEPDVFARAASEQFLVALWDLRLEVGHGVRDRHACEALAATDLPARTALLDLRRLAGDPALYAALEADQLHGLTEAKAEGFITDKIAEMRERRERFGDSLYLLEPNVKQSEGGLRDLQSALWLARVRFKVAGISELLTRALLPERDIRELRRARDFIWRARNALHFLTRRKTDQLTFDVQPLVAHGMGYGDPEQAATGEAFMRHYYLAAKTVLVTCDAIVDRCLEPRGAAARASAAADRPLPGGELEVFRGRLAVTDREVLRSPAALVRVFATADREGLDLHPHTRDLAAEAAERLPPEAAVDPEVNQELLALFTRPGTRGRFLARMHDLGVLSRVLPEFARITARRQIDVYHVYTVDVHSLFAVRRLFALRCGDVDVETLGPLARGMARPLALYLGTLFHDIGKGSGSDHSARGAEIASAACSRLGVDPPDAADVEWLVLKHLRMSAIAQRRDLSDPHLIHAFAEEVGTVDRLEKLYLLTYADLATVGPGTWTEWKGQLLRELYVKTRDALAAGERRPAPGTAEASGRAAVVAALAGAPRRAAPAEIERFLAAMPPRYFTTIAPARAPRHLRLLSLAGKPPLAAAIRRGADGAAELTLSAPDRPGLLAIVAGVLAAHRIDIHAAEVFSTPDDPSLGAIGGRALDVFVLRGPDGGALEPNRWREARRDLSRVLAGDQRLDELLARRLRSSPAFQKPLPRVATKVVIDNDSARDHSVVDVFTADRVGLLHTLARTFFDLGLSVDLARIATEGHRATDAFYVRSDSGRRLEGEHARRVVETVTAALARP